MYSAYLRVLENAQMQYGSFQKQEYASSTGIGYAQLIDFDNDGTDELLFCNGIEGTPPDYQYHIYTYKNYDAVLLTEGSMEAHGGDADWRISILNNQAASRLVNYRHDGSYNQYLSVGEYINGEWITHKDHFASIDTEWVNDQPIDVEKYYIGGTEVSEAEFHNRFNSLSRHGGRIDIRWTDFSGKYLEDINAYLNSMKFKTTGENITVSLNGSNINFDQPPIIYNDRTLVPLRAIFEALGATVSWDNVTRTITAVKNETKIQITIDTFFMYKNGQLITLDAPATIRNDRTLVPVRAISEAFGCDVEWNGYSRQVIINSH